MNTVTDVLREGVYRPTLRSLVAGSVEETQPRISLVPRRTTRPATPAARLELGTAADYNSESRAVAARATNQALLLAKSAQSGLDQLLSLVEQMKKVASSGALNQTTPTERAFLRMDLSDLYRDYNKIAASAQGGVAGLLSGGLAIPVQIERAGDLTPKSFVTSIDLAGLSRPIGSGDQVRIRVGSEREALYIAQEDLYSPLIRDPVDADGNPFLDANGLPVVYPHNDSLRQAASGSLAFALEVPDNGLNPESGAFVPLTTRLNPGGFVFTSSSVLNLLTFSGKEMMVRVFLPVADPTSAAGSASIAFQPAAAPVVLRSLADTRIRPMEASPGQNAIVSVVALDSGGSGYLNGGDATGLPVELRGGGTPTTPAVGARGTADIIQGRITRFALTFRGESYNAGDQVLITTSDYQSSRPLPPFGSDFEASINVDTSGAITSFFGVSPPSGTDYLGGASGRRIPVRIVQSWTQQDPQDPSGFNQLSFAVNSATATVNIDSGRITNSPVLVSGGSGYIATHPDTGALVPVSVEIDLSAPVSESVLKVVEVGSGNFSPDAFIYDLVYRNLESVTGPVFFDRSGLSGTGAPTASDFAAVLGSLEALTPVLQRQSLRAKLEVQRLDAQLQSFGGSNPSPATPVTDIGEIRPHDNFAIKLSRMLSRVDLVADTTLSLLESARSSRPG